jgi:hypothetical protein
MREVLMRRPFFCASVFIGAIAIALAADAELADLEDIPLVAKDGEKVAREVSGCTWLDGAMWIVDNEDDQNLLVMSKTGSFAPRALPKGFDVKDLEGITTDGTHLYVMSGGGLDKKDRADARRFGLHRLSPKGSALSSPVSLSMLDWMKRIAKELDLETEKVKSTEGDKVKHLEDFKPEGLAIDGQGRMLVGIRKPLIKGRSAVISLEGWREAFEKGDSERIKPKLIDTLDLDGAGISSLEWDAATGQMLMLSIESSKHRTDVWSWDFDKPKRLARLRGHKCEGIGRIGKTDQVLILADDEDPDGTKMGRWTTLALPAK